MDRRIVSTEKVQVFDVDEDIRDNERCEPEMSWATCFDEKPRPEVKWR